MALSCLIVDDNPAFLKAASSLLERQGVTVVGIATNGAEALARARELRPDVVLLDIVLGSESGFDVARRLVDENPDGLKVFLISTHAESDFEDLIAESPAAGFLPKAQLTARALERAAGRA